MGLEQWYWYYTAFFGSLGPDRDNAPEPTCGTLMWYSTTCSHSLYTHSQPATNMLRARGENMVENRKTGENCATASQPGLCLNSVAPPAPGSTGWGLDGEADAQTQPSYARHPPPLGVGKASNMPTG